MDTLDYCYTPFSGEGNMECQGWDWGTTVYPDALGLNCIHHEPLRLWHELGGHYSWMRPYPGSSLFVEFFEMKNTSGKPLIEFPVFVHTYPCISVHLHARGANVMLYGVADKSWQAYMVEDEVVFGAALNAGTAYDLLGVPASELANYLVNLEDLLPHCFQELIDCIGAADTFTSRVQVFERFFRRFQNKQLQENPVIRYAVDKLYKDPTIPICKLAEECCISRRQLSRLFRQHVGTPPKTVARIFRLEHLRLALQASKASRRFDLAAFGSHFGYYDQAHFIKDFKDCTGITPGVYRSTGAVTEEIPRYGVLKT